MHWIEGRTVPEIGVALDMTAEQVRLNDHRMRQRFRALFRRSTGPENHPLRPPLV